MTEFVGLRAQMYAFKVNEFEFKQAKGVKKNVINKGLEDYKTCLDTRI